MKNEKTTKSLVSIAQHVFFTIEVKKYLDCLKIYKKSKKLMDQQF
jgi:hypothetical protein